MTLIKRLLLIIILLASFNNSFGQDTIKFNNGDIKTVTILKIENNSVHYTYFPVKGTEFIVNKTDIFTIKYSNGQIDTLFNPANKVAIVESKKMVYQGEDVFRLRLLVKASELGQRTNNIDLLRQVKVVKRKERLRVGFTYACLGTAVVSCGIYLSTGSVHYDEALKRLAISAPLIPLAGAFGITAIINNVRKKQETRKLTTMYNDAVN